MRSILNEISFAEDLTVLKTMFNYRMSEYRAEKDLSLDVSKEYHEGRLDPSLAYSLRMMKK
jgi:hypothetical protein